MLVKSFQTWDQNCGNRVKCTQARSSSQLFNLEVYSPGSLLGMWEPKLYLKQNCWITYRVQFQAFSTQNKVSLLERLTRFTF
jgi:hypothetical protein